VTPRPRLDNVGQQIRGKRLVTRLDKYIFLQLLAPFGFFTLALAGILWLGQTLPLVELIIDNGKSGMIFLEFSVLIIPNVLALVLPVSAFIATLYAVNKLFSESEMVIMISAGLSPARLSRAVMYYGIFVMAMMYFIAVALLPAANTRLGDKIAAIQNDAVNTLLREKQFIHPEKGITLFIKNSSNAGEITGLFLNDERDLSNPVTYSASEALLLKSRDQLRLVMSNGVMQRFSTMERTLTTVDFDKFVFELTDLLQSANDRYRFPVEYTIRELLDPQALIDSGEKHSIGTLVAELHNKFAQPLLGLGMPLIAAAMLLSAKYRRSGYAVRITVASFLGLFIVTSSLMVKNVISKSPDMFWIAYVPALVAFIGTAILMLPAIKKSAIAPKRPKAPAL